MHPPFRNRAPAHACGRRSPRHLLLTLLVGALCGSCVGGRVARRPAWPEGGAVRVLGRHLVNERGRPVRLLGVNRSGAEFACVQGKGLFDGPVDEASIEAMKRWDVNTVRVPLNESCWLGHPWLPPETSGERYREAVVDYVRRLGQHGLYVILSLHWSAVDEGPAVGLAPMPNRAHSPRFWHQVARTFREDRGVVFDLFNEPTPDDNQDTPEAWRCWRDGGTCRGVPYPAAGMQELVDVVRATGARQLLLVGGVQYAARLSRWLEYQPVDPLGNLAPSWHQYDFAWCSTPECWDAEVAPLAAQLPLVTGEVGQKGCGSQFLVPLLDWLDVRGASYLAWTWNSWSCDGPSLITDTAGTPLGDYGQAFQARLRRHARSTGGKALATVEDKR